MLFEQRSPFWLILILNEFDDSFQVLKFRRALSLKIGERAAFLKIYFLFYIDL